MQFICMSVYPKNHQSELESELRMVLVIPKSYGNLEINSTRSVFDPFKLRKEEFPLTKTFF